VRDLNEGANVATMTLEHYPGMTEKALAGIVEQAKARWTCTTCSSSTALGQLEPTGQIVLVVVTSAHRGAALRRASS